jgi:hypothetical protein
LPPEEGGLWTAPLAAVQKAHLVVDPWAELKAARAKEKKSDVDRARARRSDAKETR